MVGIILGIMCGAAELWLLRLLINGVMQGAIKAWVIPAKMAVLAVFFVPCALIWPAQLVLAGIAAGAVLVVGSAVMAGILMRRSKKSNEPSETEGGGV